MDRRRATPLHLAAEAGHTPLARLLLSRGADANVLDWTPYSPLHLAAMYKRVSTCALLLENGADPNCRGLDRNTPLHLACLESNILELSSLLSSYCYFLSSLLRCSLNNQELLVHCIFYFIPYHFYGIYCRLHGAGTANDF